MSDQRHDIIIQARCVKCPFVFRKFEMELVPDQGWTCRKCGGHPAPVPLREVIRTRRQKG